MNIAQTVVGQGLALGYMPSNNLESPVELYTWHHMATMQGWTVLETAATIGATASRLFQGIQPCCPGDPALGARGTLELWSSLLKLVDDGPRWHGSSCVEASLRDGKYI